MKYLVSLFLLLSIGGDNLTKASRINHLVQEAETYYHEEQYPQAIQLYKFLLDSLKVSDQQLILNLAHASFMNGDLVTAQRNYTSLTQNTYPLLQSIALTQLGIIFFRKENPERALYHFKKALLQNPANEAARYNYELIKKYLATNPASTIPKKNKTENSKSKESPPQNNNNAANNPAEADNKNQSSASDNPGEGGTGNNQPGDQNKQDLQSGRNPANQISQGEKGNTEQGISNEDGSNNRLPNSNNRGTENITAEEREMQTLRARLKNTNLSPEKAKMLLEAMRSAELQYLQQLPRKQTKSINQKGPDW